MLTINNVIILRNSDLKRFFDIEEFWIQRQEFIDTVKSRTIDLFFDSDKEKECFTLFCLWSSQKGTVQAEFKGETLYARVDNRDRVYALGRLTQPINSASKQLSMKDRIGMTLMYLMLGADETNSSIDISYDFLLSHSEGKSGIPSGDYIIKYDDWNIVKDEFSDTIHRKIIVNKSSHAITISSGNQSETLMPMECVVGLFSNEGCYRLLPHHIVSPDGGLQLRLVCGNNCANLEIHKEDKRDVIIGVSSIFIEKGNNPIYLKNDGVMVYDKSCCYAFDRDLNNYKKNHGNKMIVGFDVIDGFYKFF